MNSVTSPTAAPYRILSLDGGGAKGFYTLGVLKEIEALTGQAMHERFDLIFGTSTGAIIAALLALGTPVDEIHRLYKKYVPAIMKRRFPAGKSEALEKLATEVFGAKTFTDVKTGIGIVATHWALEKPMIFKGAIAQAQGRHSTFVPGFGCTIADAVRASCSAYPFFKRPRLKTSKGEEVELMDGGYCANNPTLYAIADAVVALQKSLDAIRVVSVGVGAYPEPKRWGYAWLVRRFLTVQLLQKTLNVNTFSMEQLRAILFKKVWTVRINDTFDRPEMATDLMEHNTIKLNMLYQRGSESFAKHENELKRLFDIEDQTAPRSGDR
jgi:patatin-like phospholipase/acyl hydrolase